MLPLWYIYLAWQEFRAPERAKFSPQGGKLSEPKRSESKKSKTPEPLPVKTTEKPKHFEIPPKTSSSPIQIKSSTPEQPEITTSTPQKSQIPIRSPSKSPEPPTNLTDIQKHPADIPKLPEKPKTGIPTPWGLPPEQPSTTTTYVEAPEFPGYKIPVEDPIKKVTANLISSRPLLIPTPEPSEGEVGEEEEEDDEDIIAELEEELIDADIIEEVDEEELLDEEDKSRKSQAKSMVDAAVLEKLEAGFKKLEESDSKSLLKKYLNRELFDKLKNVKTPSFGSTLLDVIQSGLENHDSGVGIYAPDAEAYSVFADLFDPIIEDYHSGFKKTDKHPNKDWGDVDTLGNLDPTGEFIISTRVRCGRSLQGYPFNPCLTEAQYKEMEDKTSATFAGFSGELKGTYYPLTGMTKETQQKLIDDHFLFKEGDRFLQAANACRFWPTGRGIFHNDAKTFLVWCNEEDHLRIISMQMGGDLGQVYRRLVSAVNDIEKRVPFSHHDRLGFLTFCPTNLGTTVRASVHIKVPKLASNKAKLEEVAGKFNLQVRGTRGEHTEAEGGVYDISNKRRMGLTEYEAVKEMHDGIAELIKIEKEL